ncbi:MAG: acetyl-CoA carboxylase biotin carboxyl carrier protein [Myxococcota bacterium]
MGGGRADGRVCQPELAVDARRLPDGRVELRSPAVGLWRGAPAGGAVVTGGTFVGELEVLGVRHALRVPADARGQVVERPEDDRARIPVGFGERLLVLDPEAAGEVMAAAEVAQAASSSDGLFFRASSSGRFYGRPAPDKPPFVSEGQEIGAGDPVCLLEVMKTFNRIAYAPSAAEALPERARVLRIVPEEGADLSPGDPILELEPVG